jgi:hypothetical protein
VSMGTGLIFMGLGILEWLSISRGFNDEPRGGLPAENCGGTGNDFAGNALSGISSIWLASYGEPVDDEELPFRRASAPFLDMKSSFGLDGSPLVLIYSPGNEAPRGRRPWG